MKRTHELLLAAGLWALTAPVSAALLGVQPGIPNTSFTSTVDGATSYNAGTDLLQVHTDPVSTQFAVGDPAVAFDPSQPRSLDFQLKVDAAGNLAGGVPGDDLVLTGTVGAFSGTLLTGEVLAFGSQSFGITTNLFDARFRVTGGSMASLFAGQDIGVTWTAENSGEFTGSFTVSFTGGAKGNLGPIPQAPVPDIEICTLVTLNPDMVNDFSDADAIAGDGCDVFPQNIPVGVVGAVDATYRLKVNNVGTEPLTDVTITSPDLGLVAAPIPDGVCGDGLPGLEPGEMCIINFTDVGFETPLKVPDVCQTPGRITKLATTTGTGAISGIPVSDDDPASVDCVVEPAIDLRKEVSLDGINFFDANTPAAGPTGPLGADATYRLTVTNTGTETLVNAVINDGTLGLVNVPVPGGPLNPGDVRVITSGDTGFAPLFAANRCNVAGNKLNIARVDAEGQVTTTPVNAEDPANLNCENPRIEVLKQVSLTGAAPFFDADNPGDADVPVGVVGSTTATYRLIVRNIGSETLVNALISDPTLGLTNVPVPGGPLLPGEERTIDAGDIGFGALEVTGRCDTPGNKSNIVTVNASGQTTGTPVSDDNPANVECIVGPAIQLLKQVSLDGVNFFDADSPGDADVPVGELGADATYRLIVRNTGDEVLANVRVTDATLGLTDVPIPGGPLGIGEERVIDEGDIGALFFANRCDSVGNKANIARVDAAGQDTGQPVQDENPANVECQVPVACALAVDKTCLVVTPPATGDLLCQAAIAATTLRYTGPDRSNVTVTFDGDKGGLATYSNVDLVSGVTILTQVAQNGFTVDSGTGGLGAKTKILIDGVVEEIIHTSCSAIYEAGQPAPLDASTPNPPNSAKGDPSPNWFVVNFRDKDGNFVEQPAPTPTVGADACVITPSAPASCPTGPKPTSLTFRYTGGGCAASNQPQGGKAACSGAVDPNAAVSVLAGKKGRVTGTPYSVAPTSVAPNGTFVMSSDNFSADSEIQLSNAGGTEVNLVHTSCSKPLAVGDVFGSLTLVAFDGQGAGADVTYDYRVSNIGTTDVDLTSVLDNRLGELLEPAPQPLAAGDTTQISRTVTLDQDTVNTVVVSGNALGAPAAQCSASDTVVVTVEQPVVPVSCSEIKPITALSMVWNGPDGVDVVTEGGEQFLDVRAGNRITFSTVGLGNDVDLTVSGGIDGLSRFHVSCSDAAMNGTEDCGTPQGDGKDNNAGRLNLWLLDGMTGANGSFDCGLPNTGEVPATTAAASSGGSVAPAATPTLTDKEFKWKLTNTGSSHLFVTQVKVTWPDAQGQLEKLKWGGDVFADKLSLAPPSATVTDADFVTDTKKRRLDAGKTEELKVEFTTKFTGDALSDYTVEITFDNGDVVSFP